MNTGHSEQPPNNEASERLGRELLDVNKAMLNRRAYSMDGWVVISDLATDGDASEGAGMPGLLVTRRFDLAQSDAADSAPAKRVVLHFADAELDNFRFACAEAARAEHERSNPLVGLQHYRAALQSFPFLPGLDILRDQLMAAGTNVVEMSLQSAEDCLKDRRKWKAAQRPIERAGALIEAEETFQLAFGTRYELLQSVVARITKLLPGNRRKLDLAEELDILRELRDELSGDVGSYWHLPGWRSLRTRLEHLDALARQQQQDEATQARRRFVSDANSAYNDASASGFIERHLQAGHPPPLDEDVARLQLEETEALLNLALHVAHLPATAELFDEEVGKLEGWRRDLHALIGGLNIAQHRAQLGLREPEQLDVARYVLGVSARKPATSLLQVPQMFVGHPSFLQCKAFVEACASRRAAQERLLREIGVCLQFDAATEPEQISAQGTDGLIHTLRSQLSAAPQVTYPIELAWDKLREMKTGEPEDACGLQKTLIYCDSEDYGHEVVSLSAISEIVQRKVRQIHILRNWLRTVAGDAHGYPANLLPGTAHWPEEKRAIEVLANSGPSGLMDAQARCKAAQSGAAGTQRESWPLEKVCRVLSRESALNHLRDTLSEIDPAAAAMPLCAPAHALDRKRQELWLTYDRQLRECDELANNIVARIDQYAAAWDAFEESYRALMTLPLLRRRRVAESAEWQAFQQAAAKFCGICAHYEVFRAKLQDVKTRYRLQPECLDERET